LSRVTQEHLLLQLAKLHDPAVQGKDVNLTIDYMIAFGNWDDPTRCELVTLHKSLERLADKIRSARNKALSHNDLVTILAGAPVGAFPAGEDVRYFQELQRFVDVVNEAVCGGPSPFNDLAEGDARRLVEVIERGLAAAP
jgi:hypothetical protein